MDKKNGSSPVLWFFIILLFIVAGAVLLFPVYQHLRKKQAELQEQKAILAEKRGRLQKKQKEIDDLENSPAAVERVAREQYHMARENETVMFIENPKKQESEKK